MKLNKRQHRKESGVSAGNGMQWDESAGAKLTVIRQADVLFVHGFTDAKEE